MISLSKAVVGAGGNIAKIGTQNRVILGKLLCLGIIPGAEFRLLRKKPAFLLRVGHTLVVLDKDLAAPILINAESSPVSKNFFKARRS